MHETILFPTPLTNSPIIKALDVNAIVGMTANGNCSDITAFKMSFIPVKSSILLKNATQNVGTMAMSRVLYGEIDFFLKENFPLTQ